MKSADPSPYRWCWRGPTSDADLQFDLELAIVQKNQAPAAAPVVEAAPAPAAAQAAAPVVDAKPMAAHRWRIEFRPYPQLFVHGNDPLRMLRELSEIGDLHVQLDGHALPSLEHLDPESCYLAWEITVDTDATRDVIQQVFDWAEGDCELKITEEAPPVVARPVVARAAPT